MKLIGNQKFEYKIYNIKYKSPTGMVVALNELGADGWEVICSPYTDCILLKREYNIN